LHTGELLSNQSHEGYRVKIEPVKERIRAMLQGQTLVDSTAAFAMTETRKPSVFYFPRDDIQMDLLQSNPFTTHCPFKGNASHVDFHHQDKQVPLVGWSYEDGFDEAFLVRNYIAFDWHKVDAWYLDNEAITEQPGLQQDKQASNPFVPWLLQDAWRSATTPETLADVANMLRNAGVRLWRLKLFIRTLNPQLYGRFYTWQLGQDLIEESKATHKGMQSTSYLNSPFAKIINGEGGIRRKLEGTDPKLDYPILDDLLEEGATDYVALPMHFSDSQINILSLVSNEPGGFKTSELGYLYEILPLISRLVEAHAQRDSALTLLQTYLGKNAGQRVLSGHVKRGDGEDLDAIIWFSDLRNSTQMADSMDRLTYLKGLDQYFDCVAGAVVESGGEVLKFIGDAILAIFPVTNTPGGLEIACAETLAALKSANQNLMQVNETRVAEDLPELRFGTGLHRGNITYGNIGAEARLDFTVIGPAVNEASRIEGLCKKLGESVLASAAFAEGLPGAKRSLGHFELAGVKTSWELFTLEP
jgi:adenylate cyclase